MTEAQFKDLINVGVSGQEAKKQAMEMASEKMRTLAALHNPDLKSGGKDMISDFGDRNVNSRIGAQWKTRVSDLDEAAKRLSPDHQGLTKMNVKLERCK